MLIDSGMAMGGRIWQLAKLCAETVKSKRRKTMAAREGKEDTHGCRAPWEATRFFKFLFTWLGLQNRL